ncbi:MAG TPA: biotin transporter BioY [Armatimonadota bacterium]|nr:biotin transporter BioY [Armatimonadota bacterium]
MQNTVTPPPALALLQRSEAARDAMLVLLFGALTAVAAQLSILLQPVPLTGTMLLVLLSGALLGPRLGLLSQLTYLSIGFLGAPVFAGGKSTLAVMLGPTAGYLVAFPLAAWLSGVVAQRVRSLPALVAGLAAADVLVLLLGGLWLGFGSAWIQWAGTPAQPDLAAGVLYGLQIGAVPFIGVEAIKIAVATAVAWPLLRRTQ